MSIPPHRTREDFARELGGNVPWMEPSDVHLPMDADIFGYTHLSVRTSNNDHVVNFGYTHLSVRTSNNDHVVNFGQSKCVLPNGNPMVEASVEFLAFADGELLRIEATYEGYVGAPPRGRWCRYRIETAPANPHEEEMIRDAMRKGRPLPIPRRMRPARVDPNEIRRDEASFDAAVEEIERG